MFASRLAKKITWNQSPQAVQVTQIKSIFVHVTIHVDDVTAQKTQLHLHLQGNKKHEMSRVEFRIESMKACLLNDSYIRVRIR